ncbi:MAG: PDDEXK nuclease domain-containing protein [Deltaproteobacteria bacterium]|jgi:predicted nuclease of restriction endonuclease-like (RecB) superfamily|nr:PDDEXK nuclease domain-containing protein [Deltaproteobacteria bacterium]
MSELTDNGLYEEVKNILELARSRAYAAVNFAMVEAYWHIGRLIVEQQGGAERAGYGSGLISDLAQRLTAEYGKGYTPTNLKYMRQFYLQFQNRHALRDQLSWTHYRMIMKVENENARQFYLDECVKSNWSSRQLDRQINSFFYERLLSSQGAEAKNAVSAEIHTKEPGISALDVIKDPYVLEFLGLNHSTHLFESDLEDTLITHIQKFLLELGRGFALEARQKRICFDGENFYIDLVFYNYILKCFVLIDLKAGRLTHQDIGQMQMYVNYYTRELTNEGDNPPIGIILCADKSESVVRFTLPESNTQIFTSKYKLYLPTEDELLRELKTEQALIAQEKIFNQEND